MGRKFHAIAGCSAAAFGVAVGLFALLSQAPVSEHMGVEPVGEGDSRGTAESFSDKSGSPADWNFQQAAAPEPSIATASTGTFGGQKKSLARVSLASQPNLPADILDHWSRSNVGESITIPLRPPAHATVSVNRMIPSGDRVLVAQLEGYGGATLALMIESSGALRGHFLNTDERPALKISRASAEAPIVVEGTDADGIVCVRVEEDERELGIEPEPFSAPASSDSDQEAAGALPDLNSKPGAARVIYLDFDGEVVQNTWWKNGARINAQPYAAQQNIPGIWEAIAEDYAPFNVNVTTNRAVFDNAASNRRCMVIFTPTNDAAPGAGGVAYLNTFGDSVTYMSWVFNSGLNGASEAGSHEAGHQLGLRHDGTNTQSYYSGHRHSATGIQWGPIMGASYNRDITQWSNGGYRNADNTEDDLSVIANYLPSRADDHANSRVLATAIAADSSGAFSQAGMIEKTSDVDYFSISTQQVGPISVAASPTANYRNLDVRLRIFDSGGSVLATGDPPGSFSATVGIASAPAGTYYVAVEGVGLGSTGFSENGYDDYGSVGPYSLSGSYPASAAPDPPQNVSASDGALFSGVTIQWNAVTDADNYEIYRGPSSDPVEAVSLGNTSSRFFVDEFATQGTIYFYFVRAMNGNGQSVHSEPDTGYTGSLVLEAPEGVSASDSTSTEHVKISWLESAYATAYFVYRNTIDSDGGTLIGTTSDLVYFDTTAVPETTYYYSVTATTGTRNSQRSARDAGTRAQELSPPPPPANVVASDGGSENFIIVQWDESTGAESYRVYRGESPDPNSSSLISSAQGTGETIFYDTDSQSGINYYYFVQAINSAGSSAFSGGDVGFRSESFTGDDAYENNDSLGNAYDLRSGEERWLRTIAGYGVAGNNDWFLVELASGESRVEVILNFPPQSGDIDLGVYDEGGTLLADSVSTSPNETIAFETKSPGATLYLRVFPKSTAAGHYDLKWKSQPTGRIGNLADMTIGKNSSTRGGADLYSTTGGGQTIVSKQKGKRKHSASLSVENEGAVGAGVSVFGTASNRKFQLKYFQGASNVTSSVKTGRPFAFQQALEERSLTVVASPRSRKHRRQKAIVWTRSSVGGNSPDTATMVLKSKKSRRR